MKAIKATKYTHRFLARFVIEAKTPLSVGSGEKDIITDALVATDVNGLPYIPGTAIAGVVRSMLKQEKVDTDEFFGFQKGDKGKGSQIIFTEAKILNSKGEVMDGLNLSVFEDPLLKHFKELPIRQHARINEKGVTVKAGKFDEQVVFAGTRFCFELEMVSDGSNYADFEKVLNQFQSQTFRIGSGTRCGFGEVEVIDILTANLNLKDNLQSYFDKSSNLQESAKWVGWKRENVSLKDAENWTEYKLILQPEDFFLFGSGFGDDEADMTPVKAKKVDWSSGKGVMKENLVLIPATSVKGALAHRVAFHWNKINEFYAGDPRASVGNENPAVQALFGYENQNDKVQKRGNLIFSDVIKESMTDKILNHVAIDRFTGGAIDGALFSEKTTCGKGKEFVFTILADNKALSGEHIQESLEDALKDICKGLLPLGGGVNRGNGVFTGILLQNGKEIFPNMED